MRVAVLQNYFFQPLKGYAVSQRRAALLASKNCAAFHAMTLTRIIRIRLLGLFWLIGVIGVIKSIGSTEVIGTIDAILG